MQSTSMFSLEGRVAIVTGGAGLLAREHALALAGAGAAVVLTDKRVDDARARAEEVSAETGSRVMAIYGDVSERASWEEVLRGTLAQLGRVDVLVNNAAFTTASQSKNYGAAFADFPLEDWNAILEVNLTGTFLGCQTIGAEMLRAGRGSIINLASLYGVVSPNHRMYPGTGIQQPVAYSVSKAAVLALTRYLGTLWMESGVRVNCLTPGGVFNDHNETFTSRFAQLCPAGRMARPDEMRGAVLYLASDASSYCTAHNLVVDGGWTAW